MPSVSLDGLVIDRIHGLALDEATRRIELAADDLSKGSLASTNPKISRPAPQQILLAAAKTGWSFEAQISIAVDKVTVELKGQLELSRIQMVLAGGESGVRKRVCSEVEQALNDRLGAA